MKKTILLGLLVLLAMLVMPTASAHVEVYFEPQHSSVPGGYCNITHVKVMANITAPHDSLGGQFAIYHNHTCADITDVVWGPQIFAMLSSWNNAGPCPGPDHDWFMYMFLSAQGPGVVEICNLTIHCNCSTCDYCITPLNFSCGIDCPMCPIMITPGVGSGNHYPDNATMVNGTVECGEEPQEPDEVDLNVTVIEVNPDCNNGDVIFVNQSNLINVTVYNSGPADITDDFHVRLYNNTVQIDIDKVVHGLAAGAYATVSFDWTPPCIPYNPLSGEYPADGILTTLSATVDIDDVIAETDETNNTRLLDTEVSANGYKSKNFDCSPSDPLELFKYDGVQFYGGLEYNVSGTKVYPFDPGMNQTRIHSIDLPPCATGVKDARLYIVGYDYFYNPVPGCLPNLSVDFNGAATFTTPDAMYTDQKAYGTWDTPKWKYAYNVTDYVNAAPSNDYSVTVENIDPTNSTTLLGGILVVVYEGDDCDHVWLCWKEGCDLLSGRTEYCSSTTEATATVDLCCNSSIPLAIVNSTELITVVDQGMTPGSNLLFNGNIVKTDAWDAPTEAYLDSKINIETYDVPIQDLSTTCNTVGFQDTGTSGMQANLAFLLITKKSEVVVAIDPCPAFVYPEGNVTVNITLSGIADYGSGTITLSCEPCDSSAYALIESVGPGDSGSVTHSPLNDDCVTISASNIDGLSGDVRFATVTLKPMGNPGECICLKLVVDTLYDRDYNALQTVVDNCTCCTGGGLYIIEDDPPFIVSAIADPPLIYNNSCPGCPRCTNLTVTVTDATGVAGVWVDLTPILGPGYGIEQMCGPDGSTSGVWWCRVCANYSRPLDPYCLNVTAVDLLGNWNDDLCIPLEVRRVGDVNLDNKVDAADYLIIAQYTVGLRPAPDLCLGDIVPPADPDGIINMGDALYIAMYATIPGYPEIGSLCPCPCPCPCLGPCP